MSTTFAASGGVFDMRQSMSQWARRLRVPLDAWSRRRRCVVALLIAALIFALGAYASTRADLSGVEASRAALSATARRFADAKRALAQLPALRVEATASPAHAPASWASADDVRVVSQLAAENGFTLLAVEPGASSGTGIERMRPLQITAHTDFIHLMAFMHGLSDLAVLVAPVDITVRRDGGALSVSATLNVYSALRPATATTSAVLSANDNLDLDDDEDVVFFDPFALPQMLASDAVSDALQLRLMGMLRDSARALALLDTPEGATTAVAGQQIGAEHVTRLDALGMTLAGRGGATRTLAFAEAS
ncbi:hypothetical protein AAGS40_13665 [Paraburkholderia sp. PREW-6R]|uniref:hypothetical protein n=1 Tax=Paraburkholderia sp. PREW-6R TaxID=3141544 RepID=UPI0031F5A146